MAKQNRREFVGASLATLTLGTAGWSHSTLAQNAKPHVVIVGGGAGGASAARHIVARSEGKINVTLVEANKNYQCCFFSNHYLGAFRAFDTLTHSYDGLVSEGIEVIHDRAMGVDRDARKVKLSDATLTYDALILAPGIDFIEGSVQGWTIDDQERMPHAYQGGDAVALLREQIDAMPPGGVFAIVPPQGSYRCPPGPYERVTTVAHLLKQTNPTAKIIIADPKPLFSKMSLFRQAWRKYYKGMIDMNSDVDLSSFEVDPKAMTIKLDGETIKVDVCNVIPAQRAGEIAHLAEITVDGWAPVHAYDLRSKLDENVYVLGDAAAQGDMPKSAFSAHSQALVCVDAIVERFTGKKAPTPSFFNTCWSLLATDDSVKIGAAYNATPEGIKRIEGFVSQRKESPEIRKDTFEESLAWYDAITSDMFG